ncbi:hypothetical protein MNBD_NITROSPINAE02-1784 [hydrothermal vent metagenome]|uniref:Glycosyltransferase family 4 protein n=1 Tax=hydrothermal vent metagenome TaxID=652676 RepID=A0A3B1CAR1_9ZZZZ
MRVTMVIPSMGSGGAERVMSVMVNYWAAKEWEITLITLAGGSSPPFYKLVSAVRYVPLGVACDSSGFLSGLLNNFRRIKLLRREIIRSAPQVVISFIDSTNVLSIIAAMGTGTPVIVSEHNDPFMWKIGRVWDELRKVTYPFAKKIVLLSESSKSFYSIKVREKSIVIPNPIVSPAGAPDTSHDIPVKKPCVMAMGRFDSGKGFDILLKAFASAIDKNREWSLVILGDGPLRRALEQMAVKLGIEPNVSMPGTVKNPFAYLRQADIFVLSSRYEGFPMALCEAMACGAPVVSFDCKTGPGEIITDGADGILVPAEDGEALSFAVERLMKDKAKRARLGANATKIVDKFGVEKVMKQWEKVLQDVL